MHASRASSRALKHLAAGSKQARSLHMTGPATFSNLLTSERPALNLPGDVAALRAECQKRKLPTSGSKTELTARLSAHELSGARAFSAVATDSKRPVPETATPGEAVRHFNTSRSRKAVNDTSTIDFAYIPDFDPDSHTAPITQVRVPILPQTESSENSMAHTAADAEDVVMLPTIMTVAADGTHIYAPSAMSEVSDNNSIDFQGMAAQVASRLGRPADETAGMARQLWTGFVDDVLGPKTSHA